LIRDEYNDNDEYLYMTLGHCMAMRNYN